jgi:energy-converting hydrogenase A subunit E
MLAYDEALALLTFVAVTAISTFVIVRLMEWRDASCR